MRKPITFDDLPERARAAFSAAWVVDPKTGCWIWAGKRMQKGYGILAVGRVHYRAHRLSYFLHYGVDPAEKFVCHSCDNPPCVNPDHLWLGTAKDNTSDMLSKRRHAGGNAAKSPIPIVPQADLSPFQISRERSEFCRKCGHHRTDDYPARRGTPARCRPCSNALNTQATRRKRSA